MNKYIKKSQYTDYGYQNNAITVYGELNDGNYFAYVIDNEALDIFDDPITQKYIDAAYNYGEDIPEADDNWYDTFYKEHNINNKYDKKVLIEIESELDKLYNSLYNSEYWNTENLEENKKEEKYNIYTLSGEDGVYNSNKIDTVDTIEQAEDRVAELRAETGENAYYEEVVDGEDWEEELYTDIAKECLRIIQEIEDNRGRIEIYNDYSGNSEKLTKWNEETAEIFWNWLETLDSDDLEEIYDDREYFENDDNDIFLESTRTKDEESEKLEDKDEVEEYVAAAIYDAYNDFDEDDYENTDIDEYVIEDWLDTYFEPTYDKYKSSYNDFDKLVDIIVEIFWRSIDGEDMETILEENKDDISIKDKVIDMIKNDETTYNIVEFIRNNMTDENKEDSEKLIKQIVDHSIYECMDCGKEFESFQSNYIDDYGTPNCPYCGSGDVVGMLDPDDKLEENKKLNESIEDIKYNIYILEGEDGIYNSSLIDTVDSEEQAEDRVAELQAETGSNAYYKKVINGKELYEVKELKKEWEDYPDRISGDNLNYLGNDPDDEYDDTVYIIKQKDSGVPMVELVTIIDETDNTVKVKSIYDGYIFEYDKDFFNKNKQIASDKDIKNYKFKLNESNEHVFSGIDFETKIPNRMRFKEYDVIYDESNDIYDLYWVTQQFFSKDELNKFVKALKELNKFNKAYVTVRDLSTYIFKDDLKNNVLVKIELDTGTELPYIDDTGYKEALKNEYNFDYETGEWPVD